MENAGHMSAVFGYTFAQNREQCIFSSFFILYRRVLLSYRKCIFFVSRVLNWYKKGAKSGKIHQFDFNTQSWHATCII